MTSTCSLIIDITEPKAVVLTQEIQSDGAHISSMPHQR